MNYLNQLPDELLNLYYENLKKELIENKIPYDVKRNDDDEYPSSRSYFSLYNSRRIKRLLEFFKTNPKVDTLTAFQKDELFIIDTLIFSTIHLENKHNPAIKKIIRDAYNRLQDFYVKWMILDERYKERKSK
jgi:hypothetical protein